MQAPLEEVLPRDLSILTHAYAIEETNLWYDTANINYQVIRLLDTISIDWLNCALWRACGDGHIEMAHWLIKRGANAWDGCFCAACNWGHIELVRLMLTGHEEDIDSGQMMCTVCKRGYIDIARLLVTHKNSWMHSGIGRGLDGACTGGHTEIVTLMIEHGAMPNRGIYAACEAGRLNIVQMLIAHGANAWNDGLRAACWRQHTAIIRLMIESGASYCYWCNKPASEHVTSSGQT